MQRESGSVLLAAPIGPGSLVAVVGEGMHLAFLVSSVDFISEIKSCKDEI